MLYHDFQGLSLSALGLGAMRLPVLEGNDSKVDQPMVDQMVDYAISHGINYFDTAWGYHDGHSEAALRQALSRYPRESYYLADKFPGYDLSNMGKVEEIFQEQLARCGVECFDFYLFHNVCEMNIDPYLNPDYHIFDYLVQQKNAGRIKHLGFSAHGSRDLMERFLKAYGSQMEFCQIQLNYLDWNFQDAKGKMELLKEYHLPVWVMEPLRGGKLAKLEPDEGETLNALRPEETAPGWAFRFLQSIPEVTMVLAGMSTMEQLQENVATFAENKPLNKEEMDALLSMAGEMVQKIALPCTGCHYCVSHCPQGLDIPSLLALYNEHCFTQGGFIAPMALMAVPAEKQPSACIGCRSCEAVCPQQIKISEAMADFTEKLNG